MYPPLRHTKKWRSEVLHVLQSRRVIFTAIQISEPIHHRYSTKVTFPEKEGNINYTLDTMIL